MTRRYDESLHEQKNATVMLRIALPRTMDGTAPRALRESQPRQPQPPRDSQTPDAHDEEFQQRLRHLAESQRQCAHDLSELP